MSESRYLIVGLGNIGKEYTGTRHNIGFRVIDGLAEKYGGSFQKKNQLKGDLARLDIEGKKVFLLKPATYMNNSGRAVKATINFFKIELSNLLIVVDDIAIDFGEFRLRVDSGTGGHKGLESIETFLGSRGYPRLRIGVSNKKSGDLARYVLDNFSEEEKKDLQKIINRAIEIIHLWLMQGIDFAMNQANVKKKKDIKDER